LGPEEGRDVLDVRNGRIRETDVSRGVALAEREGPEDDGDVDGTRHREPAAAVVLGRSEDGATRTSAGDERKSLSIAHAQRKECRNSQRLMRRWPSEFIGRAQKPEEVLNIVGAYRHEDLN
jgi:hypothetical protein